MRISPQVVFGIATLLSVVSLPAPAFAATPLEVSGWIPYWREATATADVLQHLNQLTEINPFGYIVQPDGSLLDALNITKDPIASLIAAAKTHKVRVVPTVMWSDTTAIHAILSNTTSRIALEKTIANLAQAQQFDGIDIDFEGKQAADKNHFSTFLKGLYARMGSKWVMCTIEARTPVFDRYSGTPPPDATEYANDYTQINKYCDRVRLMTYDQGAVDVRLNALQSGPYVPVADPAWVLSVVKLAEQSISKNKLMIGVPTYGYEYQVTPLTEQGFRYDLQWAFNPKYALQLAAAVGAIPLRNSANELSFMYMPTSTVQTGDTTTSQTNNVSLPTISYAQGSTTQMATNVTTNILWWSDAKAIQSKMNLAKELGVRGISLFKLDGGEDPGLWSILPRLRT